MHTKIVQRFLSVICICIFGYYAYQSLTDYLSYNTVSKHSKERQEEQLMPQTCFSSPYLAEKRLQKLGITKSEYAKKGLWTSSLANYSTATENEIKRLVFPNLTDILNKVKVRSRVGKESDKYQQTVYTSEEILNGSDIRVVILEYYWYFSIYCLSFSSSSFPFGIEKLFFTMKQKSLIFIVAPGNFYSLGRKRNQMNILADQSYEYQVKLSFSPGCTLLAYF